MKLAEALNQRAALQTRISELDGRLRANAKVQEGMEPAEDPRELLAELEVCVAQLEELIARINKTNEATKAEGKTLTELLAKRDCLKLRSNTYRNFLSEASSLVSRGMRSEIRVLSTVPVAELRKTSDAIAEEFRKVDAAIQAANWTTELL